MTKDNGESDIKHLQQENKRQHNQIFKLNEMLKDLGGRHDSLLAMVLEFVTYHGDEMFVIPNPKDPSGRTKIPQYRRISRIQVVSGSGSVGAALKDGKK